jgi:cation:H+ antiporter
MTDYIFLAAGLVLLIIGGEFLVRGASTTAERLGMSPLLIGLTLVGFGTSMPELVTSVEASWRGAPGIAVGNVVGSNIANILLILGIAAAITPIAVQRLALARDGMVVLASAAAFCAVGYFLPLDRLVGAVFLSALVGYIYYAYRQETAGAPSGHTAAYEKLEAHDELFDGHGAARAAAPASTGRVTFADVWAPLALAIGGLLIVVFGGKLLVTGATGLARNMGISETVIGLTIVSIGTSLPELVTSIIAAIRRHSDVALGNILGSNIYNVLGIAGTTGVLAPTVIPVEIVNFDNLVMLGVSILLLIFARTGWTIGRTEGLALLTGYLVYLYVIWPA